MQKKGVAQDLLFWIAAGAITLLVIGAMLYMFSGGANEIINSLPF